MQRYRIAPLTRGVRPACALPNDVQPRIVGAAQVVPAHAAVAVDTPALRAEGVATSFMRGEWEGLYDVPCEDRQRVMQSEVTLERRRTRSSWPRRASFAERCS
eukprot:169039-Prorocentrum_minimum.AAC.1